MFRIEALNSEIEAKELSLSDHLFHEALRLQPESKTRFHVKNDKGENFDIVYWDNEDDIEPTEGYPKYVKPPFIARYPFYDEADTSTLYLEFLHQFDRMMFEELNEYTVVLTSVILSNTEMDVWCRDARIFWFTGENDRIHIVDTFPENRFADTTLYIQEQHRCGLEDGNFKRRSAVYAFHNVFFLQWILNGRNLKNFKFLTLPINDAGGIGALLSAYTRNQALAERLGLKFVAPDKDHFGKYPARWWKGISPWTSGIPKPLRRIRWSFPARWSSIRLSITPVSPLRWRSPPSPPASKRKWTNTMTRCWAAGRPWVC